MSRWTPIIVIFTREAYRLSRSDMMTRSSFGLYAIKNAVMCSTVIQSAIVVIPRSPTATSGLKKGSIAMPVTITISTEPYAYTPVCRECSSYLASDISQEEYLQNRSTWDSWMCPECSLKEQD